MEKQIPFYPTSVTTPVTTPSDFAYRDGYAYNDGVVTWDLGCVTDEFYEHILREMKPTGKRGGFVSRQFEVELVWMRVDDYIDNQIRILNYDDPAQFAFDLAINGEPHEDYIDDPDYDPFIAFEMSASSDIVQSIVNGIANNTSVIPVGIMVYKQGGDLSDFQEGRHRSLALHIMDIPLIPVWVFKRRK